MVLFYSQAIQNLYVDLKKMQYFTKAIVSLNSDSIGRTHKRWNEGWLLVNIRVENVVNRRETFDTTSFPSLVMDNLIYVLKGWGIVDCRMAPIPQPSFHWSVWTRYLLHSIGMWTTISLRTTSLQDRMSPLNLTIWKSAAHS